MGIRRHLDTVLVQHRGWEGSALEHYRNLAVYILTEHDHRLEAVQRMGEGPAARVECAAGITLRETDHE